MYLVFSQYILRPSRSLLSSSISVLVLQYFKSYISITQASEIT